nr:MAG TPA: Major capsid protein [Caudoviricetes sp.]
MKNSQLISWDLQLFAEDELAADETTSEDEINEETKEKTYTRSDIAKMIAAEKAKWVKESKTEIEQRIEEEKNEAARLAKLSEEERQQALIQKEKEEFEKEKAAFRQEQLLVEKGKRLQEIGIPSILASRIHGNTAEEAIEDVKSFKAEWDKALKVAVDKALLDSVDNPLGSGANNSEVNPFAKDTLNLTEQGRLFKEDPKRAKALQALANKK